MAMNHGVTATAALLTNGAHTLIGTFERHSVAAVRAQPRHVGSDGPAAAANNQSRHPDHVQLHRSAKQAGRS